MVDRAIDQPQDRDPHEHRRRRGPRRARRSRGCACATRSPASSREMPMEGLFIAIGYKPNTDGVPRLARGRREGLPRRPRRDRLEDRRRVHRRRRPRPPLPPGRDGRRRRLQGRDRRRALARGPGHHRGGDRHRLVDGRRSRAGEALVERPRRDANPVASARPGALDCRVSIAERRTTPRADARQPRSTPAAAAVSRAPTRSGPGSGGWSARTSMRPLAPLPRARRVRRSICAVRAGRRSRRRRSTSSCRASRVEHFADRAPTIANMRRLAASRGGTLVATTVNWHAQPSGPRYRRPARRLGLVQRAADDLRPRRTASASASPADVRMRSDATGVPPCASTRSATAAGHMPGRASRSGRCIIWRAWSPGLRHGSVAECIRAVIASA